VTESTLIDWLEPDRRHEVMPYVLAHRRWRKWDRLFAWATMLTATVQMALMLLAYGGEWDLTIASIYPLPWAVVTLAGASVVVGRYRNKAHERMCNEWRASMGRKLDEARSVGEELESAIRQARSELGECEDSHG
jgi:hypothetical protein